LEQQNYYLDPSKGGHSTYVAGTAGYFRREFDTHDVKIQDMRGREEQFDLSTHGFQHVRAPTVGGDFRDADFVEKEVYKETEKLLKEM
jgi:hypothetical protein